ncbi:MAG: VWA domain-containing protein [Nanoarchaeota archaeon]
MQTAVIYGDSSTEIKKLAEITEKKGSLASDPEEQRLMRSVLDNDKETIKEGKLIKEALNVGLNSFSPDLMFEQLVKNYSITKKLYGPTLIRELSGYDDKYIDENIRIPEFQKEIKKNINENIKKLKEDGALNKDGIITDKGVKIASLILYTEELDKLVPKGIFGEKIHKKRSVHGSKAGTRIFKRGDRYRDIAIKKSIKLAIRRNHKQLNEKDLHVFERQSRGQCYIIYALDASGSMKGKKLEACKKAGIALAYKAIEEKDKVGLMVFGSELKEAIEPSTDFPYLLDRITRVKASKQTDIATTLRRAVDLFPNDKVTKHLILLTDALPTIGEDPEKETLEEVSKARENGITISLIGVKLDKKGEKLAKKIVEIGLGRLYIVKNLDSVDKVVLEDYYGVI